MKIISHETGYTVENNKKHIMNIQTSRNPNHIRNCYIDFDPDDMRGEINTKIFDLISDTEKSPLQAMVNSHERKKIKLLSKGGFKKVRVCHEMEVMKDELRNDISPQSSELLKTTRGELEYIQCCELLFKYYKETHESINPLSASFESFIDDIPNDVLYDKDKNGIKHVAFIEENEIAYVCSNDEATFESFLHAVASEMFLSNDFIYFEADDVDWCGMALKNLFTIEVPETFDTWLFEGKWM